MESRKEADFRHIDTYRTIDIPIIMHQEALRGSTRSYAVLL